LVLKDRARRALFESRIVGAQFGTAGGQQPLVSLLSWKIGTYVFVSNMNRKDVRLTAGIANVLMAQIDYKT
jgi:hypothetical protein